jgi:type I restriction enzyme M protein
MFVQSEKFVEAHGGRIGDVSIYGQESNHTTWRLAKLNLAIRGIDARIARGDSFHADEHKDLKADYVLANPPFNDSDWGGDRLREDVRWKYGVPPAGNANFAWVQHFLQHLSPTGIAGFVLANGSMSSQRLGREAHAYAMEHYTWEAKALRTVEIYDWVLKTEACRTTRGAVLNR